MQLELMMEIVEAVISSIVFVDFYLMGKMSMYTFESPCVPAFFKKIGSAIWEMSRSSMALSISFGFDSGSLRLWS